ncbi:lipid A-modifier LpxR family protein [Phenylobacterium deserti]|nr:lipid A-modifier LpxR family protein [Phenylobacterium deserti]
MAWGAIVLGCAAASAAGAQPAVTQATGSVLAGAAFAPVKPVSSPLNASGADDGFARLIERNMVVPAPGSVSWEGADVAFARKDGAVDSVRLRLGSAPVTPGGLPLRLDRSELVTKGYEVAVTRDWPNAVSLGNKKFDLDVSPHAGVGMTSAGGSAEAGARMELSRKLDAKAEDKLRDLGVRDGAEMGERGRWYLFAAASGKAVGLNMLRGESGWDRAGWTMDPQSTMISDAQVGVGWRRDHVQSSFGVIHREVKGKHLIMGQHTEDDTLVAFSVSVKPRR